MTRWTQQEESYLMDRWGEVSYGYLSKKLNKSQNAISLKAWRLGLSSIYNTGEYLNTGNIERMLGINGSTVINYWIKKYGLKAQRKALKNDKKWLIKLEDLLEWLEGNQDKWDSRRVELYALGVEPDWLKEKRKRDLRLPKRQNQWWTEEETRELIFYYKQGKIPKDIAKVLGRSEHSIYLKLNRLRKEGEIYGGA